MPARVETASVLASPGTPSMKVSIGQQADHHAKQQLILAHDDFMGSRCSLRNGSPATWACSETIDVELAGRHARIFLSVLSFKVSASSIPTAGLKGRRPLYAVMAGQFDDVHDIVVFHPFRAVCPVWTIRSGPLVEHR